MHFIFMFYTHWVVLLSRGGISDTRNQVLSIVLPGFSVTAPWAFNWFLDGNENKVDISIVGTNGNVINTHLCKC